MVYLSYMEPNVHIPLAERLRPKVLNDVVGQEHITHKGGILYELTAHRSPASLILWGPPGTGKTTLARIVAKETNSEFLELSAVTSGKADVTNVIEHARANNRLGLRTTLFVDEIHRFNKAQQDAFLPHVENGTITLIGATTENPSFEVIAPLLSRCRVVVLQPLSEEALTTLLQKARKSLGLSLKVLPTNVIQKIARLSGGDGRAALGTLELALQLSTNIIDDTIVEKAAGQKIIRHDKNGEQHYGLISAFIKSLRGSDTKASLYYLERMLAAGEDPKFIARRMIIFASEDIGLSGNGALSLAVATFQAVERIGMPETRYTLYHCATALAKSEKSRQIADYLQSTVGLVKQYPDLPVPLHLRNAPTTLMKNLGYSKNTKWEAGFVHPDGFLPPEMR